MTDVLEGRFRAAVALHRDGKLAEAEVRYRGILADHPDLKLARRNLVALMRAERRWTEAEDELRLALSRDPTDPDLQYDLGCSLLASGDYAAGWPLYEARRAMSTDRTEAPRLAIPEWRGEAVRSLLVWGEQGFGDQIQFARYLPLLRARGVAVTLVCRPGLERLFEALDVAIIPARGHVNLPTCDAWTLMGSLSLRFDTRLDTIPSGAWLAGKEAGAGLGVVAHGNPGHSNDAHRSLPDAVAAELLALPGAISLAPEHTGARDFLDTAEIVRGLERVITVDTAVAHLAGAMGKPVWILLPAVRVDWRWLRDRGDSPWYPSATLFRQEVAGDWSSVLDAVRRRL